jgi:DNA-binding winged helix-turn-helix (wHTH) protein/TolB-like protein/Tfp pilus assembly protein PilF
MPVAERYAFGSFVLERSQQRVLHRNGTPLSLTPRLFSALLLFVERAGELLDKDTLMRELWPGLVVEENNLSQVISGLRRALGDDAQGGRFIQTVPRRGFRFVAAVTVLPEAPAPAARQVESSSELQPAAHGPREAAGPDQRRRLYLTLAAGLAGAGAAWWAWRRLPASDTPAHRTTLAVLPFKPLSAEGRDELLELGMADSLIARLSSVPGLVVRSTGSVVRYAGAQQDSVRAARELEVNWIVDGSLQRRGDRFRATARLLRAADGVAAWSGGFDEKFTGVFEVQDQISERVMQALAPTLQAGTGARSQLSELGGTRSAEAYQLYLAAHWRAQGGRAEDIDRGIALLNQALGIDPAYALAWALLAWTHRRKLWNADAVPADVFGPANAALRRALALVPTLAQAQAGLGFSRYWYEFDWPGGEREFRSALATNPNEVSAHHGLAQMLLTQDRIDEGFVHVRLARELDPMSPLLNTLEASYLLSQGRLAEARTRLNRAFDITPNLWLAHVASGLLSMAEHRPDQGIAALRRAVELAAGSTRPNAVLAVQLTSLGRSDEARVILDQLLARSKTAYVPPNHVAAVHAALGEVAPALAALEQAYLVRDTRLIFLKDDPHWARLRNEPRFVALMKILKLDRYGPGLSPV